MRNFAQGFGVDLVNIYKIHLDISTILSKISTTLKKKMRDHETNIRRTVKTATTKMMTPKTQSTNEDIRATIQ
jgi:hypothetical protein